MATCFFEGELEGRPSRRRQLSGTLALLSAVLPRAGVGGTEEALRERKAVQERLELVELLLRDLLGVRRSVLDAQASTARRDQRRGRPGPRSMTGRGMSA